jgi:integrase
MGTSDDWFGHRCLRTPAPARGKLSGRPLVGQQFRLLQHVCVGRSCLSGGYEAACRWREQGLDLREIQLLLGHSTLLMTQRCLNVSEDELATAMSEKMWKRRVIRLPRNCHATDHANCVSTEIR